MKTLIIYGTKTGATEKCAGMIRETLLPAEVDMVNIRDFKRTELSSSESVIVGTSVYMGKIHAKIRNFLNRSAGELMNKKLHLFVCGLAQGDEGTAQLKKQMPGELYAHASQVRHLGNEINFDRLNPFFCSIIKKIIETEKPKIGLLEDEIKTFAENVTNES